MKNILITGATGFIGKNVIERFSKNDEFKLLCFVDNADIAGKEFLKTFKIETITINDIEKTDYSIDICLHLASYGVKYGDRDLDKMIDVNIKLSEQIMRFAKNNGCKSFINMGSCFEYGTKTNKPIDEEEVLEPEDIYASSKVACETILKTYAKLLNIRFVSLRLFSVYGKYEPAERLYPLIMNAGKNNKTLELTKGEQIRDYLNVEEVAEYIHAIVNKMDKIPSEWDAINVCSGKPITIKSFITKVANENGFDISLFKFGAKQYRANEAMCFVGDTKRLSFIKNS